MRSLLFAVAVVSGAFSVGWIVGAALGLVPHTLTVTIHAAEAAVTAGCISVIAGLSLIAFEEV